MNGAGYNVKEEGMPDMIGYINIVLSDDVVKTTR